MRKTWGISIAVAIGGSIGALSRYALGMFNVDSWPLSTLFVNVVGSFVLGILTGYSVQREVKDWLKGGIGTGFCGGLTTMSTFSKEVVQLSEEGSVFGSLLYIVVSLSGGLLFCFIGILIGTKTAEARKERVS
jgi:fluoride exporter